MPEGNELHRYRNLQHTAFAGRIVNVDAPNGRFSDGAKLLHRRRLKSIEAFGKHLFYDFGQNRQLHVHLGLYEKFRDGEMPYPEPKGALRLRIWNASHWLELRGPTACDVVSQQQRSELLARIGPDPLREDADVKVVHSRIANSRAPIGALLMDQAVIGGLGNIFRAELLFRARLNPFCPGNLVTRKQVTALWKDAQTLMRAGMVDRRIVTTKPSDRPHKTGRARRFETHYVYKRKGLPCFLCNNKIFMREFVGRKLYWCANCQSADRLVVQTNGGHALS